MCHEARSVEKKTTTKSNEYSHATSSTLNSKLKWGFSGGTSGKALACNAGDMRDTGSILGLGRSPAEGNGNPLPYSCLENPMDRGAWQDSPWGYKESDITEAT